MNAKKPCKVLMTNFQSFEFGNIGHDCYFAVYVKKLRAWTSVI